MSKCTVFISDLHIGTGAETNWYQKDVHEPLLKSLLRYLLAAESRIEEVVILGDWFDLWNYEPCMVPPSIEQIMRQNPGVFSRQTDGDFISLLDRVRVRFVNGDHDMQAELSEINRQLAKQTFQRVFPGHGTDCEKSALANTYYLKDAVWAEHGHQHDLFNKPSISVTNPVAPLPLGYFVTRIYCHFLQKKIASTHRSHAACVISGGTSGYESFGARLPRLVEHLLLKLKNGEQPDAAKFVIEMMMQRNRSNFMEFCMPGGSDKEVNTEQIPQFYPDLVNYETFYDSICEAAVSFDGLGHFVRAHFNENPHARVVVMGHTHCVKTLVCGNGYRRIFANSGYFCPGQPDIKAGRVFPSFVEVERLADSGYKVRQKAVCGVFPEDVVETSCNSI